jgi:hypothetical protein
LALIVPLECMVGRVVRMCTGPRRNCFSHLLLLIQRATQCFDCRHCVPWLNTTAGRTTCTYRARCMLCYSSIREGPKTQRIFLLGKKQYFKNKTPVTSALLLKMWRTCGENRYRVISHVAVSRSLHPPPCINSTATRSNDPPLGPSLLSNRLRRFRTTRGQIRAFCEGASWIFTADPCHFHYIFRRPAAQQNSRPSSTGANATSAFQ